MLNLKNVRRVITHDNCADGIASAMILANAVLQQTVGEEHAMITPAFLTGSRAYGAPRRDSDYDIVIMADEALVRQLDIFARLPLPCDDDDLEGIFAEVADDRQHIGNIIEYENRSWRLRTVGQYGIPVDLVLCTTIEAYEVWRIGTDILIGEAPVTREHAIETFDRLWRERANPAPRIDPTKLAVWLCCMVLPKLFRATEAERGCGPYYGENVRDALRGVAWGTP